MLRLMRRMGGALLSAAMLTGLAAAQDEPSVMMPAEGQAAAPAAQPQEEARQPILQILVEGNQRVEADTILSYLLIQPGDVPDPRPINLSIQTLFSTGLFSDVRVAIEGRARRRAGRPSRGARASPGASGAARRVPRRDRAVRRHA